ncbi:MAG: toll/interleukin-1 receptor domain-containing protein [Chloroflexi bacterium]|nr:toll/interleukin-1 receptor domain-containing protein [Chloroflexota bacterium]
MTTVFISYAPQDRERAQQVYEALTSAGINAWMFDRFIKPGDDWTDKVKQALDEATYGVFLLSPTSLRSPSAKREYLHFLSQNKPLYVTIIQPVDDDDVPYPLRDLPAIDLTEDFEGGMGRLIEAIRNNLPDFAASDRRVARQKTLPRPVTVTLEVEEDTDTQKVVDLISRLSEIGIKDIKVVNGASRR